MEGAGASMLSPAAELATRGMDSADEEPELPSAVQDLIRRLGETNWSYWSKRDSSPSDVTKYCILMRPEVKDFFPDAHVQLSTNAYMGLPNELEVRHRVLEAIGSSISSSEELDLHDICGRHISRLTASEWEVVLRGFKSSSVLRKIYVGELTWTSEADLESLGLQLGMILNTSSVTELTIDSFRLTERFFLNLASGLRENSHSKLNSLEVGPPWGDANAGKFIVEVLNFHSQLKTLSLGSHWVQSGSLKEDVDENIFRGIWKQLIRCLRDNKSVTSLSFSLPLFDGEFREVQRKKEFREKMGLDGEFREIQRKEEFRDLMSLLEVNLTIREIDVSKTPWARDGTAALIEAALKQNQERAVYMSVFTEANLPLGDAKVGRLFICGSPGAGKTQLHRTLMKIIQDKTWIKKSLEKLSRTKGIEVEFLQNDHKMLISISELAGHVQNVLFQTNDLCVFLFMYNPFRRLNLKPLSCFEIELNNWLTFISSSTKVTGHNRPQVFVVISHKDKMTSSFMPSYTLAECTVTWAKCIVKLRKRFAKCVDLRTCHYVNAREKKEVITIKNRILFIFRLFGEELLSKKSPQLYFQLSFLLLSNIKKNKTCPLWSVEKFHDFCYSSLKKLIPPSSVDHPRLCNNLISSLNDVGSIIYIPNLQLIIVDVNWFTNSFFGELIAMFQAQESGNSYSRFVSESVFARSILAFLGKQPLLQNVDRVLIENILFKLDLGFKLKYSSQYFIPSFIREYDSNDEQQGASRVSMSWHSNVATSRFVGIRIQCEDLQTMSLTAAFFLRFQMFMRRKLKISVSMEAMTFSRHYLKLYLDGHQVYVEQVQSKKCHIYIDVLMLCSEHKSKEVAIKFVLKHIVQELISFCASPKGCPGVTLVLGLIQTICVKRLLPSHLRGAILIEELKSKFSDSINDKLGDIQLDRSQLVKEKELLNYEYTWPWIRALNLKATFERATNLLWESHVEAVLNEIRQKRNQQLESLQQSLMSLNDDLAQSQPESERTVSNSESERTVSNSSLLHREDCDPASASCSSQASTSVYTQLILSKMGHIISLQQQLQSTFSDFMSKVDRMIGYSESHQQAKTPKRPYVTNDVGLLYKMSASLQLGETVRLRLMCESIIGFHHVKGQEGVRLRLHEKNRGWIQRVIEISYKVMYYAEKAGLYVNLGLGSAIPQWDDLKTDGVRLDGISKLDGRAIRKGVQSEELNQAWLRIQQTLKPVLKDNYSKIFRLYQVKYKNGGHAWVCAECMTKHRLYIS